MKNTNIEKHKRNIEIYNLRKNGTTLQKIADEYDVSRQRVEQIVKHTETKLFVRDNPYYEKLCEVGHKYKYNDKTIYRAYNSFKDAGIFKRDRNKIRSIETYSKRELFDIYGIGPRTVKLFDLTWGLVSSGKDRYYNALKDAANKMNYSNKLVARVYNCMIAANMLNPYVLDKKPLKLYSDAELLSLPGFGISSLTLYRASFN